MSCDRPGKRVIRPAHKEGTDERVVRASAPARVKIIVPQAAIKRREMERKAEADRIRDLQEQEALKAAISQVQLQRPIDPPDGYVMQTRTTDGNTIYAQRQEEDRLITLLRGIQESHSYDRRLQEEEAFSARFYNPRNRTALLLEEMLASAYRSHVMTHRPGGLSYVDALRNGRFQNVSHSLTGHIPGMDITELIVYPAFIDLVTVNPETLKIVVTAPRTIRRSSDGPSGRLVVDFLNFAATACVFWLPTMFSRPVPVSYNEVVGLGSDQWESTHIRRILTQAERG